EEQLVLPIEELRNAHRPVRLESEVVPLERILRLGGGELVLLGVQNVVAQEFEEGAVVGVAARLGEYVDLCTLMPVLRRVDADLNLELLNRVNGGQGDVRVEVHVHVVDAVERVVIEENALPASGD